MTRTQRTPRLTLLATFVLAFTPVAHAQEPACPDESHLQAPGDLYIHSGEMGIELWRESNEMKGLQREPCWTPEGVHSSDQFLALVPA